jgi:hypothetical protein
LTRLRALVGDVAGSDVACKLSNLSFRAP